VRKVPGTARQDCQKNELKDISKRVDALRSKLEKNAKRLKSAWTDFPGPVS